MGEMVMTKEVTRNNGRLIYISGEITESVSQEVNIEMIRLQREDPLEDITLIVDSYGGELFAAFSIVDCMDMMTCDIRTICLGKAMSAGQFIFSCGSKGKRFMASHSRLMIHNPVGGYEGSVPDIEIEIEELQRCRDLYVERIAESSNSNKDDILQMISRNVYLDARQAIEHGFADAVIKRLK